MLQLRWSVIIISLHFSAASYNRYTCGSSSSKSRNSSKYIRMVIVSIKYLSSWRCTSSTISTIWQSRCRLALEASSGWHSWPATPSVRDRNGNDDSSSPSPSSRFGRRPSVVAWKPNMAVHHRDVPASTINIYLVVIGACCTWSSPA